MPITMYGTPDPDPTLLHAVETLIGTRDAKLLLYPRTPIDARPCQYPGRLRYEIVYNGTAYAAYQHNGTITLPTLGE